MVSSCLPLWAHLAVSVLGAAIGSAGALIFIFVFDNKHAGFWSLLSALLCFCLIHLHSLHWYKALPAMYTKHSLAWIKYAAVILAIMSGVAGCTYISVCVYYKIGIHPMGRTLVMPAVQTLLTAKWAVALAWTAKAYSKKLGEEYNIMS